MTIYRGLRGRCEIKAIFDSIVYLRDGPYWMSLCGKVAEVNL